MTSATRWVAPVALAIGLGFGSLSAPVHAQDSLTRALVDVAGVMIGENNPYNPYGGNQRVVQYDAYGRPVYQTTYGNGYSNRYYGQPQYGQYGNGYYGNRQYGNGYYGNPQYGNGYYGNQQYSNGYYGNSQYGNGYYGHQQYGNPPYGNANGYYNNAYRHQGRGRSSRQHRQHDQHDCVEHGQCDH